MKFKLGKNKSGNEPNNSVSNKDNVNDKSKKKLRGIIPKIFLGLLGFIVMLLVLFFIIGVVKSKTTEGNQEPDVSNPNTVITEQNQGLNEGFENTEVEEENNLGQEQELNLDTDTEVSGVKGNENNIPNNDVITELPENYALYSNSLLGLEIGYPHRWYYEESSDLILNVLKDSNVRGKIDLNKTPLSSSLIFADFYANDNINTRSFLILCPNDENNLVTEGANISIFTNLFKKVMLLRGVTNLNVGVGELVISEEDPIYSHAYFEYTCREEGSELIGVACLVTLNSNVLLVSTESEVGKTDIDKSQIVKDMLSTLRFTNIEKQDLNESNEIEEDQGSEEDVKDVEGSTL